MTATRALVALIVLATALFVVGVTLERHQRRAETPSPAATTHESTTGESGEQGEGGETGETTGPTTEARHESSEKLLGVDPESTGLLIIAVAASLLLALAVWRAPHARWLLGLVVAAMVVFAALDVREAIHQNDEANTGLTVVAIAVAALHLTAAALAARQATRTARRAPPTAPAAGR